MAAVAKTDSKNSFTGGDCSGAGGHDMYDWKARREAVMGVPLLWPGVRRRLAGGEPMWRRRNSENFKIMKPWKSVDEDKDEWMAQILSRGLIWMPDNSLPSGAHLWVHAL